MDGTKLGVALRSCFHRSAKQKLLAERQLNIFVLSVRKGAAAYRNLSRKEKRGRAISSEEFRSCLSKERDFLDMLVGGMA